MSEAHDYSRQEYYMQRIQNEFAGRENSGCHLFSIVDVWVEIDWI